MISSMLDEVDRGVVHALHIDGRVPFNRIGEVLGVSTQTVARRYRRLRAEFGLRVVGLPDPGRTSTTQWLVRLTCTPAAARKLAQALARRGDTSWVMLTSGGTELFLIVDGPGPDAPALLLDDLPRTSAITGISAHNVLHTYLGGPTAWPGRLTALDTEQRRKLLSHNIFGPDEPSVPAAANSSADNRHSVTTTETHRPTGHAEIHSSDPSGAGRQPNSPAGVHKPVSPTDAPLFSALRADGRATLSDMAGATGWSQSTVARRIADLRAAGALYFDVDIDDRVFGVTTRALLWATVVPGQLDAVAESLSQHEELAFVAATTGRTNLIAEALCPDPAALHRYLTRRLGSFDAIHALETTPVLYTVKSTAPPTALTSRPFP
ncbi:Lrp/AsnC family transcriptional regulator [Nocardia sp. NPDC101769]|uniref:Lrp/AsnC family transcriptional regulator n=1 Tax=Nocardia sp. NPDC101769 TaxID=3364333 RepID=UPI0038285425